MIFYISWFLTGSYILFHFYSSIYEFISSLGLLSPSLGLSFSFSRPASFTTHGSLSIWAAVKRFSAFGSSIRLIIPLNSFEMSFPSSGYWGFAAEIFRLRSASNSAVNGSLPVTRINRITPRAQTSEPYASCPPGDLFMRSGHIN